jgi:hypothetical protein
MVQPALYTHHILKRRELDETTESVDETVVTMNKTLTGDPSAQVLSPSELDHAFLNGGNPSPLGLDNNRIKRQAHRRGMKVIRPAEAFPRTEGSETEVVGNSKSIRSNLGIYSSEASP